MEVYLKNRIVIPQQNMHIALKIANVLIISVMVFTPRIQKTLKFQLSKGKK
jgi:hypothetical protein